MESVTAPEESPVEECTCEPLTLVRYRDPLQEPSFVDGVTEGEIVNGAIILTDADGKFLFAAPLDAVLSAEKIA